VFLYGYIIIISDIRNQTPGGKRGLIYAYFIVIEAKLIDLAGLEVARLYAFYSIPGDCIDLPEVEEINPLATDELTGMVGKSVSDHSG